MIARVRTGSTTAPLAIADDRAALDFDPERRRLIEREADPLDKRRTFFGLSEAAGEGMRGYAAAVERAGLATG